jgi:ferritin-like metal-binding protein YciE
MKTQKITNGKSSSRTNGASKLSGRSSSATKKTNSKSSSSDMMEDESDLMGLFIDEVKDIYWAEKYLIKNLPKMAKASTSEALTKAFETHTKDTQVHVERLEQVFELLGEKASGKKCEAMEGLIEEGKGIIEDTEDNSLQRDIGLISAAQKVEHYEIAAYGTLSALASMMGHNEIAAILDKTLTEEKNTDLLLTNITKQRMQASFK